MSTEWYILITPVEDSEDSIIDEPYKWGPFSNEADASKAQELLMDTYAGYDCSSTLYYKEKTK